MFIYWRRSSTKPWKLVVQPFNPAPTVPMPMGFLLMFCTIAEEIPRHFVILIWRSDTHRGTRHCSTIFWRLCLAPAALWKRPQKPPRRPCAQTRPIWRRSRFSQFSQASKEDTSSPPIISKSSWQSIPSSLRRGMQNTNRTVNGQPSYTLPDSLNSQPKNT